MTATRLNGCYDRPPFATQYQIGTRNVLVNGALQVVPVMQVNTASQHCNYTHTALGQKDPGCAGCKHKALK